MTDSVENKPAAPADKKRKSKKGLWIILLLCALIITLGIVNVSKRNKSKPRTVKTVLVKSDNLFQDVSANGEIGSRENAAIVTKIGGTIKDLYVEVGDPVRRGQSLALIDDEQTLVQQKSALATLESIRRSIKGELLTLRSNYSQAKSGYERAQRTYENVKQSRASGSASEDQLTEALDALQLAESNYQSARQRLNFRESRPLSDTREQPSAADELIIEQSEEVKQAVASLNAINSNLQACDIRAGLDGIVTELNIDKGSLVGAGMVIARLHNPDLLEVIANIDEVDVSNVRLGQPVKIESDSFLDRTLDGEVSFIAPVIRRVAETRVCLTRISFTDPEEEAKVGASCSIFIRVKDLEGVPVIPIEAYLQEDGKKYAFKLTTSDLGQQVLTKVTIATGLIGIENVEVISGLAVGDEIVNDELQLLSDGQRVTGQREDDDPAA